MGFELLLHSMNEIMKEWSKDYYIYAPKVFENAAAFSDTEQVRYGIVENISEVEFDRKSDYSFKEILLPISETLFYFTEDSIKESTKPEKGAIIFLRSCDMHSLKILDQIYLENGFGDFYYERLRERVKFVLIGCQHSFLNCFCVDMGCNKYYDYDCYVEIKNELVYIDNKNSEWNSFFESKNNKKVDVLPTFVTQTKTHVNIPENITLDIMKSSMWDEYDTRCINCGRCNFVCPTCTCFSMQDIFYTDNSNVGERRRVWASCMVDGFTDMAGGHKFREKNGNRMRFRVLHKVYDYKKRNGYHMCTGCGRCDDVCPEYISYSNCINKLSKGMEEVTSHE